jgi:hypothetical protein
MAILPARYPVEQDDDAENGDYAGEHEQGSRHRLPSLSARANAIHKTHIAIPATPMASENTV